MMLTEPYYYSRNNPAAKAGSRPACSLSSASSAHLSCAPAEPAAEELIDALEAALRPVTAVPANASPALRNVALRALTALARIRGDGQLTNVSDFVAREFRLRPDDLQSRSREQRIAFVRQLAMYLCRKITGAPFEFIGEHFNRDHSTVIHAYQLIEWRMTRDAAFRLFIEKLEGRITWAVPATTPAAA